MTDTGQNDDTDNEEDPSSDFADQLDDDELWEVLNGQKDVSLHLHSQTIRFCQVLLTLLGLVLTGLAVFGPGSVASVISLDKLEAAREAIGLWPWLCLFVIALGHLGGTALKVIALLTTIGTRVALLGLTVHPIVGEEDQINSEGNLSEWVRTNQTTITIAEDDLTSVYTNLIWIFLHVLIVALLYHGAVYGQITIIYAVMSSIAVVFWVTLDRVLPNDDYQRQTLFTKVSDERPDRVIRIILEDLYERTQSTADSRFGTWREFTSRIAYLFFLIPHIFFFHFLID